MMRARWILVLSACPALVRATPPEPGWIEGTVSLKGDDVWIYLDEEGPLPAAPATATIAQRGTSFEPRSLVVPVGTIVDFPNLGPEQHNVHWVTPDYKDDLGTYRAGESEQRVFDIAGQYPIGCHRHDTMTATLLVVPTTWIAHAKNGRFKIADVAPGAHKVVVWTPTGDGGQATVIVKPGAGTRFDLSLDLGD